MNNIISIKAVVSRNLKDYKFCNKLTKDKANKIIDIVKAVLPTFKEIDKEQIDDLIKKDLLLNTEKTVLFDEKQSVAITLLEGEHLSIVSTDSQYTSQSFDNIKRISNELNNKINFLYNDQYGYLMSDISKLGAGVYLECEISLPAINSLGKIGQLANNIKRLGYSLKATEFNDIFRVSTKCNLGLSENEIYADFEKIISNIQNIEIESLEILKLESIDELTDQVYRAIGNIKYAHMIDSGELINLIIKIQIGKNLGLELEGINETKISKLLELFKQYNKIEETKSTMIELSQEIRKVL